MIQEKRYSNNYRTFKGALVKTGGERMSNTVAFKHHDKIKTPKRKPTDRIVECTRDLVNAIRKHPPKGPLKCGKAIYDLTKILRRETVNIPKSNYQLQCQREQEMPPVAPEQVHAPKRTKTSFEECLMNCDPEKTRATLEHTTSGKISRSERTRGPATRGVAKDVPVQTSLNCGNERAGATTKVGTTENHPERTRGPGARGVPVPVTQED